MLVLSRQIGESIAIGESVVVTLAVAGSDFADFHIIDQDSSRQRLVTLTIGQVESVTDDVALVLIRLGLRSGVRVGIESAPHIAVQRIPDPENPSA